MYGPRTWWLRPGETFTFGRGPACTALLPGNDLGLSRSAGSFSHHDGAWWLRNDSSSSLLYMSGDRGFRVDLPPGMSIPLQQWHIKIRLTGSLDNYILRLRLPDFDEEPDPGHTSSDPASSDHGDPSQANPDHASHGQAGSDGAAGDQTGADYARAGGAEPGRAHQGGSHPGDESDPGRVSGSAGKARAAPSTPAPGGRTADGRGADGRGAGGRAAGGRAVTNTRHRPLLRDADRLVLAARFEEYLNWRHAGPPAPRSARETAERIGWQPHAVVKRCENIRARYARLGVPGLRGPRALEELAALLISTGELTADDLRHLPAQNSPK